MHLLIAPEGIEIYNYNVVESTKTGLLIAPEGIEIKSHHRRAKGPFLLIAPEGIEIEFANYKIINGVLF